ncbi:hypothetical protein [Pseudonocardia zijingensis]|uniref:SCO6045-like C-terminal domain-containing protein n=1 Tax=Pseudonocardia zijingensis TaxID=153376 RepID=A0ABP4BAY4_9PSEU
MPETTETPALTAARERLARRQASLLSALVAGAPAPEGFDRARLRVQARALAAKRADVIAKIAPDLPRILGSRFREHYLVYAAAHPLTGGYRQDALAFARHLLDAGAPADRRELRRWWRRRSGHRPPALFRRARTAGGGGWC